MPPFLSLTTLTLSLYNTTTTTTMSEAGITTTDYTLTEDKNKKALEFIEDVTSNPDQFQQQVLTEILTQNASVEYLNRHGLSGHTDRQTFKNLIPVVTYEDIYNDITRIVNGDKSPILSSHPISEFFASSGTSRGESKLIPTIAADMRKRTSLLNSLKMPVLNQFVPDLDKGKGMYFLFIRPEAKTPGGLIARPVSTSVIKSSHSRDIPYNPYTDYTSPVETILCLDLYQSMYSQMLCGLYFNKQVIRVGAMFASGFIRAIQFLEKHWRVLIHDIRTGSLNSVISDQSVRESVMKILKPDPSLADFIEFECSKNSWKGIIRRLWPNTKYVDAIVTGSMAQYIPTLDYYSNGLPLVCTAYASSECFFGLNLNPLCKPSEVAYTLIPTMAYFEFLPVHRTGTESEIENLELVDLVDVKLGQEYEIIVTTYAGLYRYRVGDILKVVGFKNKAPQFSFICRKNVALSIDCDKTDEVELHKAIQNAINHLVPFGATLTEYTSYADTTTIPGHYVIYWEINENESNPIPTSVFQDCCLTIEESLNIVYRHCRVLDKSIGALEIRVVKNGTFVKLMDYSVRLGTSFSQYKTPRCVKYKPIVELLDAGVVSSYFSPKCPKWSPEWTD